MGKVKILLGKKKWKSTFCLLILLMASLLALEVFAYLKTGNTYIFVDYTINGSNFSAAKEVTIIDCPNRICEEGEDLDNCFEDCQAKYPPNLSVEFIIKNIIPLNKSEKILLNITNFGLVKVTNISISVYENATLLKSEPISSLDFLQSYIFNYSYTPTVPGDKLIKLTLNYSNYFSNAITAAIKVLPLINFNIMLYNSSSAQRNVLIGVNDKLEEASNGTLKKIAEEIIANLTISDLDDENGLVFLFRGAYLKERMNLSLKEHINLNLNGTVLYKAYSYKTGWDYSSLMLKNVPKNVSFRDKAGSFNVYACQAWDFSLNSCITGLELIGQKGEFIELDKKYSAIGFGGSDYDEDGFIDIIDGDDDNDGLNDSVDRINCKIDRIFDSAKNATLNLFENRNALSESFQKSLDISQTGKTFMEIRLDAKESMVNCRNPAIIRDKKQNSSFIIVSGFEVIGSTKTLYLEAGENATNSNRICIKDQEVANINEVSENCNSQNELVLKCNGTIKSNYACTLADKNYKISGLKHSAVIELGPCQESWRCTSWSICLNSTQKRVCADRNECGTNLSKPIEMQGCNQTIISEDNQSLANKTSFVCNMDWKCGDWSACSNGIQVRGCEYIRVPQHSSEQPCPTESNKPLTTQKCEMPVKASERIETCFDGIKNQNEENADCGGACKPCEVGKKEEKLEEKAAAGPKTKFRMPLIGYIMIGTIIASIALSGAIYLVIIIKRKAKTSKQLAYLENYVTSNLKVGYKKPQIRQKLLEAGWKNDMVDNVLKKF